MPTEQDFKDARERLLNRNRMRIIPGTSDITVQILHTRRTNNNESSAILPATHELIESIAKRTETSFKKVPYSTPDEKGVRMPEEHYERLYKELQKLDDNSLKQLTR